MPRATRVHPLIGAISVTLLLATVAAALEAESAVIPPGFSQVVVFATNSVRLKNGSAVTSGDIVVNEASPGPTLQNGWELSLDPFAATAAGSTLSADSVRIKNNAKVGGDVAYNNLSNQGAIAGTLTTPLALPVFLTLPFFAAQPPGPAAPDVVVAGGGLVVLPPGDYGDTTVEKGGTLVFSGGVYNLRSLTGGAGAAILFAAPGAVRIENRFATGTGALIGPQDGSGVPAHELVFYVAGINGEDGALGSTPRAAEIGPANLVAASFYAPHGTLRLGHGTQALGAFLGKDVLVENQAQIALDSFFFNRPPQAQDDEATVAEGGTVTVLDSGETSVLANDSDPDGDALTVSPTPVAGPAHGSVTLAADGSFSYSHDGSDTASDSFVYEVCDNGSPSECDTAQVQITVVPGITVTVVPFGTGSGGVGSSPAGIDCGAVCVATFPPTSPIQLLPDADEGSVFAGFSGDADCADGTLAPDGDKTCFARFDLAAATAELTVTLAGSGGGVVFSDPFGISCPGSCTFDYAIPTRVELFAGADSESVFVSWSGDAGCEDGVVELFADVSCTATFEPLPPPPSSFTLSIVFLGAGSGGVTSNPAGINCEDDCAASFPQGATVNLFARPLEGSVAGWGGDCTGTSESTVVVLDADKTCSVTFDL